MIILAKNKACCRSFTEGVDIEWGDESANNWRCQVSETKEQSY